MKYNYKKIIIPIMILVGMLTTINVQALGFNVTRTVTGVTNKVNNTFTYTVTPESNNPGTITGFGNPSNTITFSTENVTNNSVSKSVASVFADTVFTGSSVTYSQPGLYKFKVVESDSNNATVYPRDTTNHYIIEVYVATKVNGNGEIIDGSLEATYVGSYKNGQGSKVSPDPNATGGTGYATFTSAASFGRITVKNTVKGADSNVNDFFKYTVTVKGNEGDSYVVKTPTLNGTFKGNAFSNPSSCDISSGQTSCTATIYLKHNDTATIGYYNDSLNQLQLGKDYTVTQTEAPKTASNNDYTTTVNGNNAATFTGTVAATNAVTFVNTANGSTPTGIIIKIFPFIVLLVLSGVGLYTINKNKQIEEQ